MIFAAQWLRRRFVQALIAAAFVVQSKSAHDLNCPANGIVPIEICSTSCVQNHSPPPLAYKNRARKLSNACQHQPNYARSGLV